MPVTRPIITLHSAPTPVTPPAALPLSLYVHVPWCLRKCPYCDFNSHAIDGVLPEESYIAALLSDLESALPAIWGRKISTIFIGGGTPSLLSPEALDRLLAGIRMRANVLPDAEITLEANPGIADADHFAGFRSAGVNRLSLGIQSFNDRHLRALGRIHDAKQASEAAALAERLFDNFNLDLMYGLPGQTLDEALSDLECAIACHPTHLSCYQLTLEPNTAFAAAPPQMPADDLCADMQDALEARLAAAGFQHYETSAFAQPGRRCRHNLNYWTFGDYLGIGAGAHGKISFHDRIVREARHRSPAAYLAAAEAYRQSGDSRKFLQASEVVEASAMPFEFMINALRLLEGVPTSLIGERCRLSQSDLAPTLKRIETARQEGLLVADPTRIAPTDRGRRFLNPLLQRFLP